MPTTLPTCALLAEHIPLPEGDGIVRFAQTLDGYQECGGMPGLRAFLDANPVDDTDLHGLRLHLFHAQRAHYHQGGAWGAEDPLMDRMRALVARIRALVVGRSSGWGRWSGDITQLATDAIVNAANSRMLGGGGVDGAIHRAAGPELLMACREVSEVRPGVRCPVGEARITQGFRLRADKVVHTVGPVWRGGEQGEDDALARAYTASLDLAQRHDVRTIAFPAISTGVYGFPAERADAIAVAAVERFLARFPTVMRVVLVRFAPTAR